MNQGIDTHCIAIAIIIIIIVLIAGMLCTRQPTFSFFLPQLLSIVLGQRSIYLSTKIPNAHPRMPKNKNQEEIKNEPMKNPKISEKNLENSGGINIVKK